MPRHMVERTFCVYDGPDPRIDPRAAERNGRPVDPYFCHQVRVAMRRSRVLGVDSAAVHVFVQHARSVVRWFAPWASVLLISSALAYGFDLALINRYPSDDPLRAASFTQSIAGSAVKEAWHDGALSLTPPDRSADNRGLEGGGCWPPEARAHACSGF